MGVLNACHAQKKHEVEQKCVLIMNTLPCFLNLKLFSRLTLLSQQIVTATDRIQFKWFR